VSVHATTVHTPNTQPIQRVHRVSVAPIRHIVVEFEFLLLCNGLLGDDFGKTL
jgi:hypothetical protein